ncbi:MAG TPA: hypothetical protein VLK85_10800 [Ramlibacter sp.]|nr:hypothetical protein [Ramlibacter sp.]
MKKLVGDGLEAQGANRAARNPLGYTGRFCPQRMPWSFRTP